MLSYCLKCRKNRDKNTDIGDSGHRPKKIWAVLGSEFYNRSIRNKIKMYSIPNKGRFIRTLKSKVYKHMNAV